MTDCTPNSAATGSAFSFATTYALGKVAHRYYAGGRTLGTDALKSAFTRTAEEAKGLQQRYAPQIQERARGLDMAAKLPMRVLSRMWQMLLKALEEVALAPNAMMAAEMAVIRLTHVADLPDPDLGKGRSCNEFAVPALKLGAHVAPMGMRLSREKMASFSADAPVPVQPGREQVSISVSGTVQMR